MLTDAYVQFGESETGEDLSYLDPEQEQDRPAWRESRKPLIPGDSDDDDHYWWCELRGCDFSLESNDRGTDQETDGKAEKESNPSFKTVTLKKRFDWASVELFYKCCEAGRGKIDRTKDDKARINKVTVEVCRTAARRDQKESFNFPFLIIRYRGVRIQSFKIDLSSTEPSETIEFEFEELDVEFQPTDPYTGMRKGDILRLRQLKNHHSKVGRIRGQHSAVGSAQPDNGSSGVATPAGSAAPNADDSASPPGSSNLASTGVSFPGLQPQNGFGILPN